MTFLKRTFVVVKFLEKFFEKLIFIGHGPQKRNTPKWVFRHKFINIQRFELFNTSLEAYLNLCCTLAKIFLKNYFREFLDLKI